MLRRLFQLLVIGFLAGPAAAHEFWIEPQSTTLAAGDTLRPTVKVGMNFEGVSYPFEPRAYRKVVWISPGEDYAGMGVAPTTQAEFDQLAPGLHVLGVESNAQALTHGSVEDFLNYVEEVGLSGRVDTTNPGLVPGGPIIERYRRFSKTLVHFEI